MKEKINEIAFSDIHLGCFGSFRISDKICRKFCILSLRCAIEKDQNFRLEILDDLLLPEGMAETIQ
jgi:hypothetical protein